MAKIIKWHYGVRLLYTSRLASLAEQAHAVKTKLNEKRANKAARKSRPR